MAWEWGHSVSCLIPRPSQWSVWPGNEATLFLASFLSGWCDLGMRPPCFLSHPQAFSVVGVTLEWGHSVSCLIPSPSQWSVWPRNEATLFLASFPGLLSGRCDLKMCHFFMWFCCFGNKGRVYLVGQELFLKVSETVCGRLLSRAHSG